MASKINKKLIDFGIVAGRALKRQKGGPTPIQWAPVVRARLVGLGKGTVKAPWDERLEGLVTGLPKMTFTRRRPAASADFPRIGRKTWFCQTSPSSTASLTPIDLEAWVHDCQQTWKRGNGSSLFNQLDHIVKSVFADLSICFQRISFIGPRTENNTCSNTLNRKTKGKQVDQGREPNKIIGIGREIVWTNKLVLGKRENHTKVRSRQRQHIAISWVK